MPGWTLGTTAGPINSGTNTALQLSGTDGWAYQGFAVTPGQNLVTELRCA